MLFLRAIEHDMGLIHDLAATLSARRHQSYVDHTYEDLGCQRVFQIAMGYEDANDSDHGPTTGDFGRKIYL